VEEKDSSKSIPDSSESPSQTANAVQVSGLRVNRTRDFASSAQQFAQHTLRPQTPGDAKTAVIQWTDANENRHRWGLFVALLFHQGPRKVGKLIDKLVDHWSKRP
jgi:hypothetical protein